MATPAPVVSLVEPSVAESHVSPVTAGPAALPALAAPTTAPVPVAPPANPVSATTPSVQLPQEVAAAPTVELPQEVTVVPVGTSPAANTPAPSPQATTATEIPSSMATSKDAAPLTGVSIVAPLVSPVAVASSALPTVTSPSTEPTSQGSEELVCAAPATNPVPTTTPAVALPEADAAMSTLSPAQAPSPTTKGAQCESPEGAMPNDVPSDPQEEEAEVAEVATQNMIEEAQLLLGISEGANADSKDDQEKDITDEEVAGLMMETTDIPFAAPPPPPLTSMDSTASSGWTDNLASSPTMFITPSSAQMSPSKSTTGAGEYGHGHLSPPTPESTGSHSSPGSTLRTSGGFPLPPSSPASMASTTATLNLTLPGVRQRSKEAPYADNTSPVKTASKETRASAPRATSKQRPAAMPPAMSAISWKPKEMTKEETEVRARFAEAAMKRREEREKVGVVPKGGNDSGPRTSLTAFPGRGQLQALVGFARKSSAMAQSRTNSVKASSRPVDKFGKRGPTSVPPRGVTAAAGASTILGQRDTKVKALGQKKGGRSASEKRTPQGWPAGWPH
eukprot:TRINITY_DN11777_c0_g1_i10.p1 TRINITY_DN11777_c0_g1~~TRINITY_DN11777_c0_g1_i10.p1  ORF type:complete len:605 (-),score=110.17 TRINITY_DN11777_c0_g1_i10:174-1865(-)